MGPNHKDGCNGNTWQYSGDGYNRVRLCLCGAEDHAPTPESLRTLRDIANDLSTHQWVPRRGIIEVEHCGRCGVIKRTDGRNSSICRGPLRIRQPDYRSTIRQMVDNIIASQEWWAHEWSGPQQGETYLRHCTVCGITRRAVVRRRRYLCKGRKNPGRS